MSEPSSQPAPGQAKPARPPRLVRVVSVEWLTPRLVRLVFGGEGLDDFEAGEFSDHYVKLLLPPPGAPYEAPFDPDRVMADLPRELWPRTRTYTVRAWDPELRLLTLDFVVHGGEGVAGPWAAKARPGDALLLRGPGGSYSPDPAADWHLMVGDPSVLPAIGASLPRVPKGRPVRLLMQVTDAEDEVELESPGDLQVSWLHGGGEEALIEVLRGLRFPAGAVHAFVHGEAAAVRAVRRHLVVERGLPGRAQSISGYWKRRRSEEGWRQDKAEWARQVEADAAGAGAG